MLVPTSDNPPAKVKDPGVIRLVMAGAGAYNAKSGEFLFLPSAEGERRRLTASLRGKLFERAGVQPVDCGSDEAIFTLADRYVRDWGDDATAYSEERGRKIVMLGWSEDEASASARAGAVMDALLSCLPEAGFAFVEESQPTEGRAYMLCSPAVPGVLESRPGFCCPACGAMYLPDSPFPMRYGQPGEGEPEEPLTEIATPGANTIADLCAQLNLAVERTLKAMLYAAEDARASRVAVAAFVRGDCNVSMNKLSNWLYKERGLTGLRSADKAELEELIGEVAGYCGPVGMPGRVTVICDESVRGAKNTVVGANKPGYHLGGCCHGRDFDAPFADIAQLTERMPCSCGRASVEACLLRVSGVIGFGVGHRMTVFNSDDEKMYKQLSYRTREGVHQYPILWRGCVSTESVVLASHTR